MSFFCFDVAFEAAAFLPTTFFAVALALGAFFFGAMLAHEVTTMTSWEARALGTQKL